MKTFSPAVLRMTRLAAIVLASTLVHAIPASAQPALGAAQTFAVLGSTTVTNTGATLVSGDVGVSPGTAITGFPPGVVTGGSLHPGDAVAAQAHADAVIAYAALVALPCDMNLTGTDLGGSRSAPGRLLLQLVGAADRDPHPGRPGQSRTRCFVFQIGSTLTTATNSSVVMIRGGQGSGCVGANVFWQVGSSATLGTDTQFTGHGARADQRDGDGRGERVGQRHGPDGRRHAGHEPDSTCSRRRRVPRAGRRRDQGDGRRADPGSRSR